jgi:restriction system protein
MGRRRKPGSAGDLLLDLGARALLTGVAFVAFGLMFGGHYVLKGAAGVLFPLGVLLTSIGGLLLLMRRFATSQALPRPNGGAASRQRVDPRLIDHQPGTGSRPRGNESPVPAYSPGRPAPTRWTTDVFDLIEWRRFEAVVERLFQQAGFETQSQSHGADGGIDIWLYSRHQPGEPAGIVQCKHWVGRVGVRPVRELRGVMASKNVARGQFATTSTFTDEAVEFARGNGINLLDANRLLELIAQRTESQQTELLAVALEGEYWRPTCASCGVKMVHRVPRSGGRPFWGCPNFGPRKCKAKIEMRSASATGGAA